MNANTLYYGDNLTILREHIPAASVDLIYLDPPFNSNRSYNVLFRDESGRDSDAQITAFNDTWHWGPTAQDTWEELVTRGPERVAAVMDSLRRLIGSNQMMAYLVMMTARLVALHRVLKPGGSLYLHCDPTASHYLKVILDTVFGAENFRNEIAWCYSWPRNAKRYYARTHDILLFYTAGKNWTYNYDDIRQPYSESSRGRDRYAATASQFGDAVVLDKRGKLAQDWIVLPPLRPNARERMTYPTQKPEALLERIIRASSNEGDIVLDPFCGCGTAIVAAHKLKRRWLGIDITHLSVALMKYRLRDAFALEPGEDYAIIGEPTDTDGAYQLAQDDRYQFQFWATSLVEAQPLGGKMKKGADRGIDGVIRFVEGSGAKKDVHEVVVQVKSGRVSVRDIRDLVGTVERERAAIGAFITLEKPTPAMLREALSAGSWVSEHWGRFRKIQILTIDELLAGERIAMPPPHATFRRARRLRDDEDQTPLL